MRKIIKNKKGVMGLSTAQAFVIGLLALVIVGVLTLITLESLRGIGVSTGNINSTGNIINNTTSGMTTFFTNVPTWLTLLAVVVIILIIAAVIFVINRFGGGTGAGASSGQMTGRL